MTREFVTYNQALALKELGFDEACFGRWLVVTEWEKPTGEIKLQLNVKVEEWDKNQCLAPTFSQAFRWMREKYDINNCISYSRLEDNNWYYQYYKSGLDGGFKTYEEAEQACLDKLIEIVKNNAHI